MSRVSKRQAQIFSMISVIISSASVTIIMKLQSQQITDVDGEVRNFFHPIFQEFMVGIGMALLYPIYLFAYADDTSSILARRQGPRLPAYHFNHLKIFIPAFVSYTAYLFMITGLLYLDASIVQILKSSQILFSAVISYFAINKRLKFHEVIGILLVLTGVCVVSTAALVGTTTIFMTGAGISLEIVGALLDTIQLITYEWIMLTYAVHPMKIRSIGGVLFFLYSYFAVVIFSLIPCRQLPNHLLPCQNGHLEDPFLAMMEISSSPTLIILSILLIVFVVISNISIIYMVKLDSSVAKFAVVQVKTAIVWAFFLIYPGFGHEQFSWIELLGYLVLMAGAGMYKNVFFAKEPESWSSVFWGKERQLPSDTDDEVVPLKEQAIETYDSITY